MATTDGSKRKYRIVQASGGAAYEGLRDLWCVVFKDVPQSVDAFYDNFGGDIEGWVVEDESGKVCSALTCHYCGQYEGRPVYVSYAICTDEDSRGLGLGGMLTRFIRDEVTAEGGISVLSPAKPSLVEYYSGLGYEPHFMAMERAVMSPDFDLEEFEDCDEFDLDIEGADPTPFRADIDLERLSREKYNIYREAFLAERPHISPSDDMLRMMELESMDGCGMYSVNRGDAICIIKEADAAKVVLTELILNPVLQDLSMDIDAEIAAMTAKHFGAAETVYISPGAGWCQGLVYGLPPKSEEPDEAFYEEPYYGFPIP